MPNGRFISKEIAHSEQLGLVSLEADYLFVRMIPHLDVDGRITGNPRGLRARVCPLREDMTEATVAIAVAELDQAGLVNWYEVDGVSVIEFPTFRRHQKGLKAEREAVSKLPASSSLGTRKVRTKSGVGQDNVSTDSGSRPPKLSQAKVSEAKVKQSEGSASRSAAAEPKKTWVQDGVEWWTGNVGRMTHPRFGAALKPAVDARGPEVALAGLRRWVEDAKKRNRVVKVEYFADDWVKWCAEPETVGALDEGAVLRSLGMVA